jgi:8-oxoguanine deaminase
MTETKQPALWIKGPLAILADGAERGVVVEDGRIVELVPAGRTPPRARSRPSTPARTWLCRG